MKKLFIFIVLFLSWKLSFCQYPVNQYIGADSTLVTSRGGLKGRLITYVYADTTAANTERIKQYPAAIIQTTDGKIWHRNNSATGWLEFASSGASVNIYNSDGTIADATRTIDVNGNTVQWINAGSYTIYNSGSAITRLKLGNSESDLFAPNGAYGFIARDDSIQIVGVGYNTDTSYKVMKINPTTGRLYYANGSSGGGSQDLQSVTSFGDSTTYRLVTNDTAKGRDGFIHHRLTVGDSLASNRIWVQFGTSITDITPVTGIPNSTYSYTIISAQTFGFSPFNRGGGGWTTVQYSAGDSSLQNMLDAGTMPTFNSGYGFVTYEGAGINDGYVPFGHSFDTATFKTVLSRWVDTLVNKGWPLSRIGLISSPYTTSSQYPNIASYNRAAQTVAEAKGIWFVNMYSYLQTRGQYINLYDSIHPNIRGHQQYDANLAKTVTTLPKVGLFISEGPNFFYDSTITFNQIRINNFTPSYTDATNMLMVGGSVSIGNKLRLGNALTDIDGAMIQVKASSFQVGITVNNGSTDYLRGYSEYLEMANSSGNVRLAPASLRTANLDFDFLGYAAINIARFYNAGGAVFNNDGGAKNFMIKTDNNDSTFWVNGTTDKIGIGTNPDSTLTVKGGIWGKFGLRLSNISSGASTDSVLVWTASTGTVKYRNASAFSGGGGTPGGSNTQIQYNNSSSFGGITGFTSDGTNVTAGSDNLRATSPRITTSLNDANGNELFIFTATASAVNEITLANGATGNNPLFTASGGDANIGINFLTKGTGTIRLTGNSTQAAELRFYEDTDDGTNYTSFKVGTQAGDVAYTLPTAYPASNGYVLASTTAGVMSWVSSPAGTAVDTIYRTPGKDSIQFTISGRYYAIKDSVGSVAGLAWSLTGNNPTAGWTEGNFLGTTTNKSLLIRTNNIMRLRVDSAGSSGTLRLYPGNLTTSYIDYGNTANTWTIVSPSFAVTTTSGQLFTSNSVGSMAIYNGTVTAGSTSAGNSSLNTAGSFAVKYTATAVDLTLSASHSFVNVTATGKTITLPTATTCQGRIYTIKLTASGSGTVATTSSQTIDGSTTYSLSAQYKYVTVISDGSNWLITANN